MKGQRVQLAVASAPLGLLAALGCSRLLALLIRHIAIDQPSLGDLALGWGTRWGALLIGLLAGSALFSTAQPSCRLLLRLAWLLAAAAASLLVISLLAGAIAALLEKHGLTAHFVGLPNASRQAAAEAMLNSSHWAGLPVALAIPLIAFRQQH
jgi:hypothetical protein